MARKAPVADLLRRESTKGKYLCGVASGGVIASCAVAAFTTATADRLINGRQLRVRAALETCERLCVAIFAPGASDVTCCGLCSKKRRGRSNSKEKNRVPQQPEMVAGRHVSFGTANLIRAGLAASPASQAAAGAPAPYRWPDCCRARSRTRQNSRMLVL